MWDIKHGGKVVVTKDGLKYYLNHVGYKDIKILLERGCCDERII